MQRAGDTPAARRAHIHAGTAIPCTPPAPHLRHPWAAAAGEGCPKPASSENGVKLRFHFEEKKQKQNISEFLTDFYIPRTPDLLPPAPTRAP